MTLINMKKQPKKPKEMSEMMEMEEEKYPYGLRIHLDKDALKKLGITELPKVGDVVVISAKASVGSVHESEHLVGEVNRNVDLQITDLDVKPESAKKSAEEVIYGDK